MANYRYLAKNIGVLAISNFATKILSFFLVPLYTSILSTSEYGTYDLFHEGHYNLLKNAIIYFCASSFVIIFLFISL